MKIALLGTRGIPASYSGFETCVEQLGQRLVVRGHGSLGFRMGGPHMGVLRLGESAIALKVKVNALE